MREAQNISAARGLRRAANFPEQKAWENLRTLRGHGIVVRRQHTIGRYVVDFAIAKSRLVIEVDGGIHALPSVASPDAARQKEKEALGWRILRITPETAISADHLMALVQHELKL